MRSIQLGRVALAAMLLFSLRLAAHEWSPEREALANKMFLDEQSPPLPGMKWATLTDPQRQRVVLTEEAMAAADKKIAKLWTKPMPAAALKLNARQVREIAAFVDRLLKSDDPMRETFELSVRHRALTVPRLFTEYSLHDPLPAMSVTQSMRELGDLAAIALRRAIEHAERGEDDATIKSLAELIRVQIEARALATVNLGNRRKLFESADSRNLLGLSFSGTMMTAMLLASVFNHRIETFEILGADSFATALFILLYGVDSYLDSAGAERPWVVMPWTLARNQRQTSDRLYKVFVDHQHQPALEKFTPAQVRAACALYLEK